MEARDTEIEPNRLIALGFRLAILAATAAGVAFTAFQDEAEIPGWSGRIAVGLMALFGILQLMIVRLIILPQFRATVRNADRDRSALTNGMLMQCGSFSNSIAIYGIVAAFITDAWWIPLAFGAFALTAHAFFFAQASAELSELRRDIQTGAAS